jgi:uncharacterized membrane protein HdeD (DUF308 family)
MNKFDFSKLLNRFGMPVTLIVAGLILLLVPDAASILIAKLLGWGLSAAGIFYGIGAVMSTHRRVSRIVEAAICLIIGSVIMANPLLLARNIGRFLGILLAMEGGRCMRKDSRMVGFLLFMAAMWLMIAPLSLSRILFSLCGLAVLICGVISLLSRLKDQSYLESGDDDIIDAL